MPRWAVALQFVIPTGAQHSGGTCGFPFGHSECAVRESSPGFCFSINANRRSLHCATPDFLSNLVALANFMLLSLRKATHAAMSSAAWQEIRVRSGRDDKLEGDVAPWHGQRGTDRSMQQDPRGGGQETLNSAQHAHWKRDQRDHQLQRSVHGDAGQPEGQ
jgi:hypothetical protein